MWPTTRAGDTALGSAVEDVEDDEMLGARDARAVSAADVAVGITASGRTPYVAGALRHARSAGAMTVLVSSNPAAPLAALAQYAVLVDTGPEAIAGSTRLKAATAQKLILNALSTAAMVRLGRTYSNLMAALAGTNAKLRQRQLSHTPRGVRRARTRHAGPSWNDAAATCGWPCSA